jgi:proliferating cell nuclear antigen
MADETVLRLGHSSRGEEEAPPRRRGRPKRTMPEDQTLGPGMEPRAAENYDEYLFYIRTAQASCIKNFVEAIRDDVSRIPMEIGFDGIHIHIENPKEHVKVSIDLLKDNFDSQYIVKRPVVFYVDSHNLSKLFRIINTSSRIALMMEDLPGNNILNICIDTVSGPSVLTYDIKVDLELTELGMPVVPEAHMVSMSSGTLISYCKHFATFSDLVDIRKYQNVVSIINECECAIKTASITVECDPTKDPAYDVTIQNRYKVSNITEFSKCTNLSKTVSLYLSNEHPLVIEYNVGILGTLRISIPPVRVEDALEY